MSNSNRVHTSKAVSRLKPIAPQLAPLLDHREFTLYETGVETDAEYQEYQGVVMKAIQHGALKKVQQERNDRDNGTNGLVWRYRWAEGVREDLRAYLDSLDQMPDCACRLHIPDGRDAPEGMVRCNHCGQLTDKANLRERIE